MARHAPALLPVLLVATLPCLSPVAMAEPRSDGGQERARAAVEAGEVVPLHTILDTVGAQYAGSLLEVELERRHDRWVYEIRLLTPQGAVAKLYYDARTVQLLNTRGRGLEAAKRN